MDIVDVSLGIALIAAVAAVVCFLRAKRVSAVNETLRSENESLNAEHAKVREKYGPILDLDAELAARTAQIAEATQNRDTLLAAYRRDYGVWEKLKAEVALLEENLEDMSFGVYKPHYNFEHSAAYRAALEDVWRKKKEMVRAGRAAVCETTWTVGGSVKEGARMTKQNIKVMLRAFNGETDAAAAKVAWNNVLKMEERVRRAYAAINEMGTSSQVSIVPEYLDLALAELRLAHEYEQKKHEEQEEQREIRERMREEERAQREFDRAQQEAASEEERFERALSKARAEVEKAKGDEIEAANAKVRALEEKLAEAQAKLERAKSMAEQTRCGYVYVISNVGSFGESVFKIGMTRRLEPMDRVRELGDASVPFQFDVHAMMYSDDAPTLEKDLHRQFADRSVNLVNMRKEFFAVSLDEVEAFAKTKGVTVEFTQSAEAREFRETCSIRRERALATAEKERGSAPDEFAALLAEASASGGAHA